MILSGVMPICRHCALLLAAALIVSCDTPQKLAIKELSKISVEASGRSLVRAVLDRNQTQTALLLEAGAYTEQRDSLGRTPLIIAIENHDIPMAMMLLNARANLNASTPKGSCALGIAAERDDSIMLNLLLAGGARTDGLMPNSDRILPWAIRQGRLDLMNVMMKADSDPHLKDHMGNPLLHIAMESGRRDLMESLISLGADPGATNAVGETTIHLALKQGWTDAIPKLVAAGADPNACNSNGHTLLEQAISDGDSNRVKLLLKNGADPNFQNDPDKANSPLQQAFENKDPAIFEIFLNHGAKPREGNWNAYLWRAFQQHEIGKIQLLLAHGAHDHSSTGHGASLLQSAAHRGDAELVKLLVDYGFPGSLALHDASARGDDRIVGLLLACGISPEVIRFPSNDTLLAVAIRNRRDRVAELLIQYGADTKVILPEAQSALLLAIAAGCDRTVKTLLAKGADPNAPFALPVTPAFLQFVRPGAMRWVLKMDRNATPLMLAADSGNFRTARHLIKAGAKMDTRTRISSLWPINFASERKDVRMMRLFLGKDPLIEQRIIKISLSEQRARVYDPLGNEIFTTKVSTGRKGFSTPHGEFVITNKHRDWTSTLYHASMPYFQRLSCGDFGLHQGNVPGYPASHGCIRVPSGNAAKLFAMTETGDRVKIMP
ncbi:MAG: ankyrin repeat domain-containing protein [Gloeobacteraceae cyanobacterium ES-bin-144]|nr:ankyrin repeat domain-containing protein [Verrucomicrobiales bacterium]